MAKILKNTTISDIDIDSTGLRVPASSQITVPEEKYLLLATDDSITELTPLINSGDIVVNDGTNDLDSDIGIEFLKYPDNGDSIQVDLTGTNLVGRNLTEALESISQGTGIPSVANIVYVSKNGDNATANGFFAKPFLTVEAAIDYINANYTPSTSNPYQIFLTPGVYSENNPLTLPDNVSIRGADKFRTTIEASDVNEDLILTNLNTGVVDITLSGVTNASKYLINNSATSSGGTSYINIRLNNFSNGIYITTSSGNLNCTITDSLITNFNGAAVTIDDNSAVFLNSSRIRGIQSGSIAAVQEGNSTGYLSGCVIEDCDTGVKINGNTGLFQLLSITMDSDVTTTLNQVGTSTIKILGGDFDASNAIVTDLSVISGYFFNELVDEKQFRILDELSVGLPGSGKESAFGEGDSYYNGSLVFEYNGTTYTNVSANSRNPLSGTFSIPGTTVNNAIYVSTGFPDSNGNAQTFPGIKIDVDTAASLGAGEIVAEYWNGSSWAEFNHMSQGETDDNYNKYAKAIFERAQTEQIMFNYEILNDWAANDPMSLGANYYWVRFRVITAITTAPVFNYLKIHTNRCEINSDGFMQFFGQGRQIKVLNSDVRFDSATNSPANQDVYLSDNLAAGKVENEYFTSGILSNADQSASLFRLPGDLCTSSPMKLTVTFTSDDTGTARMFAYWAISKDGDSIYQSSGAAPSTAPGEMNQLQEVTYSSADEQATMEFTLDVSDAIPRRSSGIPDMIWIGLKISNSTTVDPMVVTNVSLRYVANESGEHI